MSDEPSDSEQKLNDDEMNDGAIRIVDWTLACDELLPMYLEYLDSSGKMPPKQWWQAWVVECEKRISADRRLAPNRIEYMGDFLALLFGKVMVEAEYRSWSLNS